MAVAALYDDVASSSNERERTEARSLYARTDDSGGRFGADDRQIWHDAEPCRSRVVQRSVSDKVQPSRESRYRRMPAPAPRRKHDCRRRTTCARSAVRRSLIHNRTLPGEHRSGSSALSALRRKADAGGVNGWNENCSDGRSATDLPYASAHDLPTATRRKYRPTPTRRSTSRRWAGHRRRIRMPAQSGPSATATTATTARRRPRNDGAIMRTGSLCSRVCERAEWVNR
jgi:hypothetical protein